MMFKLLSKCKIKYDKNEFIEKNDFFCPDENIIDEWESLIKKTRKE